jgi:transcription elongation factor Elf1
VIDEDKLLYLAENVKKKFSDLRNITCPQCGKSAQLVDITLDTIAYLCNNCEFEWGFTEVIEKTE